MEYLIEVEAAAAEPAVLRFKEGLEVGPFHVGAEGKWRVSGAGVADKHAYLYFDGAQLFLQSVSVETPVLADGRPLPCEWVPIAAPCEISLGDARLRYDTLQEVEIDNPDTQDKPLVPPPAPSAPGAPAPRTGPFARPSMGSDATREVPIEDLRELAAKRRAITGSTLTPVSGIPSFLNGPSSVAPPSAPMGGMPFPSGPPPSGPGSVVPPIDPAQIPPHAFITTHPSMRMGMSGTIPLPPLEAKPKPRSAWSEMPFPRKAIVILFLPMLASVVVLFFPDLVAGDAPATSASSQRSRAPATSAAPASSSAAAADTANAAAPSGETSGRDARPSGETSGPAATPTAAPSAPQLPAPAHPPLPMTRAEAAQAAAEAAAAAKDKTLQRQAADAVASGAFDRAAKLYDELAKKHPDDPTYPAAAAIARAKAAGN